MFRVCSENYTLFIFNQNFVYVVIKYCLFWNLAWKRENLQLIISWKKKKKKHAHYRTPNWKQACYSLLPCQFLYGQTYSSNFYKDQFGSVLGFIKSSKVMLPYSFWFHRNTFLQARTSFIWCNSLHKVSWCLVGFPSLVTSLMFSSWISSTNAAVISSKVGLSLCCR